MKGLMTGLLTRFDKLKVEGIDRKNNEIVIEVIKEEGRDVYIGSVVRNKKYSNKESFICTNITQSVNRILFGYIDEQKIHRVDSKFRPYFAQLKKTS